ncbi:glutamine synthetase family protein [Rubellimicrobium sp. CFH 75288]|uniref:glutamine synthetase family protein n=1 Tax=Rubellimicrobium sp. CFH 75288 TaxID=2697034 RepID=UPI001411B698|nr:glutamine synthetase family protein [Rubellimicrobium sp. CFH 75288]NAZ36599.1 glutamine synthetase [Rubellimicrobium sp. CFH 75288]
MSATLSLDQLSAAVEAGEIDTVMTAVVDMQGRLMGKRFHAAHFLERAGAETHGCDYLLALDVEMTPVPGYASASWERGYGDYVHRPDLSTLRRAAWEPSSALVMCDLLDHHGEPVAVAPRNVLRRQVERARALGLEPMMATELEFFLFEESFEQLWDEGYRRMTPLVRWNNDYNLYGSSKEEAVMRPLRRALWESGVPVENTKGEAEAGQHEVNVRYGPAMETADHHAVVKTAVKQVAAAAGRSVTFMAKYATDRAGSSSHIHQSLWRDGRNAFLDRGAPHGMSELMRSYLAGLLAHADATTLFLAPFVNSYKRFTVGMFAPTKAVWSRDNRTAGYRVCGEDTGAIRVECRIGGADLNPYMALAALLAAGLDGIEKGLVLEEEMAGDMYRAEGARRIPATLRDAAEAARRSDMLRAAFGDEVVEHYHHAARWEIGEAERSVTDWDRRRGFERL